MNRIRNYALTDREAGLAEGNSWCMGWWVLCVVCGVGCTGCTQPSVVPPTASISPSLRPNPVLPLPVEPISPPSMHPIDPITKVNPWKPDAESREWDYIVLHHTASDTGSLESIHEEHLKRKDKNGQHWLGIGYHFVVGNGQGMRDGEIEPTFRWRQQLQGAHAGVADFNQHGIGIVLIGNFEKTPPTDAQTASVKRLVGILKREYRITGNKIVGHSDVKATECPGKYFPLNDIRDSIAFRDEHAAVGYGSSGLHDHQQELPQMVTSLERVRENSPTGELRK